MTRPDHICRPGRGCIPLGTTSIPHPGALAVSIARCLRSRDFIPGGLRLRTLIPPGIIVSALAVLLFAPAAGRGASADFRGQASAWLDRVENQNEWGTGAGARYIPQITLAQRAGGETFLDLEASLDAVAFRVTNRDRNGNGDRNPNRNWDRGRDTAYIDLYRLKLRYASASTETRVGLQQLNFGPAYLLRPLKWFDVLDPRDPQGLTDGVYAASFRYVSLSNSSIWLWALYGNDDPKGYEVWPTVKDRIEYGGRTQFPLLSGEAALTYHHRVVEGPAPFVGDFPEDRLGLDGRWDVIVGAWFEAAFMHQDTGALPYNWTSMTTLGTDYTFGLRNGLHTLLEHMIVNSSDQPLKSGETSNISGFSISYPAGYIDRLSAVSFYSWDKGDYSQHLAWDHYWNYLSLNVSLFYYPEEGPETPGGAHNQIIAGGGYGGQLVLILNH